MFCSNASIDRFFLKKKALLVYFGEVAVADSKTQRVQAK